MTDWETLARRLADLLWSRGDLRSPRWYAAVAAVPRHLFVPWSYDQDPVTAQWRHRRTDGDWERVYSPCTLVTELVDRDGYREPASSSTNPELTARMLETLAIVDGHRVLEIGTGTGYQAALLCHGLGDDGVYSVDIDGDSVDLARQRLATIGHRPTLVTGDGVHGLSEYAPYDRIIATCSVPAVPTHWADRLTPDGTVLVDVKPAIGAGNLVHLHRRDAGLEGRFEKRRASFMAMRHDSVVSASPAPRVNPDADGQRRRRTDAPPQPWATAPVVWFLAQCRLPRGVVQGAVLDPTSRRPTAATLATPDGSWAIVDLTERVVTEGGPTPLWDAVQWAHQRWAACGRPGWDRLGLTVTEDGSNHVWVDRPAAPLATLSAA